MPDPCRLCRTRPAKHLLTLPAPPGGAREEVRACGVCRRRALRAHRGCRSEELPEPLGLRHRQLLRWMYSSPVPSHTHREAEIGLQKGSGVRFTSPQVRALATAALLKTLCRRGLVEEGPGPEVRFSLSPAGEAEAARLFDGP